MRDIEVVPSEKEHNHVFDLDIPQIDPSHDVESIEHVQASVNTAENKVNTADGVHCFNTESSNWMGEGSANVHVLSMPDDIPVVGNAAAMLEGLKNNKEKLDQPTFLDSLEQFNDKENDAKHPVLLNILCQMRIFNSSSPVI